MKSLLDIAQEIEKLLSDRYELDAAADVDDIENSPANKLVKLQTQMMGLYFSGLAYSTERSFINGTPPMIIDAMMGKSRFPAMSMDTFNVYRIIVNSGISIPNLVELIFGGTTSDEIVKTCLLDKLPEGFKSDDRQFTVRINNICVEAKTPNANNASDNICFSYRVYDKSTKKEDILNSNDLNEVCQKVTYLC